MMGRPATVGQQRSKGQLQQLQVCAAHCMASAKLLHTYTRYVCLQNTATVAMAQSVLVRLVQSCSMHHLYLCTVAA